VSHVRVFVFLKRGHANCEVDPRSVQPSAAHNLEVVTVVCELLATRGLSGYRARRRVADSRGPAHVAGLSLN
jgi:hypothetical protein